MAILFKKSAKQQNLAIDVYRRRGESLYRSIAEASRQESLAYNFLQLAWTAGPATYIAVQIGYYMGFGKIAPFDLIVYLAIYTLLAGILALFVRFIYLVNRQKKISKEQKQLLHTVDSLINLFVGFRNSYLKNLEPNQRKIMASTFLLNNSYASESAVEVAVGDLTGDWNYSAHIKRLEVYRRHGFWNRLIEELESIQQISDSHIRILEKISPISANALRNRINGKIHSQKKGIERSEGFIDRILDSDKNDNELIMHDLDIYEIVTLTLELVNDRNFSIIRPQFPFFGDFAQRYRDFEKLRQEYRLLLRKRNSRMRTLLEFLSDHNYTDVVSSLFMPPDSMYKMIVNGFRYMTERLNDMLRYATFAQSEERLQLYLDLKRAGIAYKECYILEQRLDRKGKIIGKEYNKILEFSEKINLQIQRDKKFQTHGWIKLQIDEIKLDEKSKRELIIKLNELFYAYPLKRIKEKKMNLREALTDDEFSLSELKKVSIQIIRILDSFLDLQSLENQVALETSYAPNLGAIEFDLAAVTKLGWCASLISEIESNEERLASRLLENLRIFYKLPISEELLKPELEKIQEYKQENELENTKEEGFTPDSLLSKNLSWDNGNIKTQKESKPLLTEDTLIKEKWHEIISGPLRRLKKHIDTPY